jgi:hypothetical protein
MSNADYERPYKGPAWVACRWGSFALAIRGMIVDSHFPGKYLGIVASMLALFTMLYGGKNLRRALEAIGIFNPFQVIVLFIIGFFYFVIAAVGLLYVVDSLKPIVGNSISVFIGGLGMVYGLTSAAFTIFGPFD